jgi:glutamyl-tRNA reductase
MNRPHTDIANFFIAGINYKKSDASMRGQFSINGEQYLQVILAASEFNIKEFFVLSTCNRTEIYGFAENADALSKLLCTQTEGSLQDFTQMNYCKKGLDAIEHFFDVAAGLDSQILGDYEIVGQIKLAAKFSKQHNCLGAYLERMVNEVLQASKKIRTTTGMSGGTVSVSFAAIQYAKQHFKQIAGKKVLLLGTGKIGSSTCKNLVDYLPGTLVTVMNRTVEKAAELAERYSLRYDAMENLQENINDADIILVATNADEPIIKKEHMQTGRSKLIIDLSVPCNVAPDIQEIQHVLLLNVDELSKIKDETLQRRTAEIPKVKAIISEHIHAFREWHEMRKYVPVLKHVKGHLQKIYAGFEYASGSTPVINFCEKTAEEKIQKAINGMAVKMRTHNQRGCQYIEAMNDFISTASN